jgi:hypothetical protein
VTKLPAGDVRVIRADGVDFVTGFVAWIGSSPRLQPGYPSSSVYPAFQSKRVVYTTVDSRGEGRNHNGLNSGICLRQRFG